MNAVLASLSLLLCAFAQSNQAGTLPLGLQSAWQGGRQDLHATEEQSWSWSSSGAYLAEVWETGISWLTSLGGPSDSAGRQSPNQRLLEQPSMRRSLASRHAGEIFDFPTCHLSQSSCSLKEMTQPTLVYTDSSNSRCWDGSPWAFLVRPGAANKLLMYYTGGGACWEYPAFLPGDEKTDLAKMCRTSLEDVAGGVYGGGALDFDDDRNFFKDYTLVSHPYCSGGLHVANRTVTSGGRTYYQHDYNNNEFARSWVMSQLAEDPPLESLVIMGSSGGSLGVALWSNILLSTLRYNKASVIMDSGMGVVPEGVIGPVLQAYQVCNTPIVQALPENFRRDCEDGKGSLHDILDFTIGKFPHVAFAHIQPKGDFVQQVLYSAVALSFKKRPKFLFGATQLNRAANKIMEKHNAHPNYIVYLVDGLWHTFAHWDVWYTATTATASGWIRPHGKLSMIEWTEKFVNHDVVDSQCRGRLAPNWWFGSSFCYEALFPKTLQT